MAHFKSKVTFKKSVAIKLHSTVILNPLLLKILNNFFFIFSESGNIYIERKLTVHHVPKCMSCHKAIVGITGRAHCFHDNVETFRGNRL